MVAVWSLSTVATRLMASWAAAIALSSVCCPTVMSPACKLPVSPPLIDFCHFGQPDGATTTMDGAHSGGSYIQNAGCSIQDFGMGFTWWRWRDHKRKKNHKNKNMNNNEKQKVWRWYDAPAMSMKKEHERWLQWHMKKAHKSSKWICELFTQRWKRFNDNDRYNYWGRTQSN